MTDIKRSRKNKPRKLVSVPRAMRTNEMIYRTSWTATSLSSGTTGTLSSWTDGSIIHSSEYSIVSSLFNEVRLKTATFIFTPTQSANGSVNHFALVVSTNMLLNANTGSDPGSYTDVQNQTRPVRLSSLSVAPLRYRFPVPRNLEFANIAADAPDPPTPWAGSPGIIRWYATGGTASTVYFNLHVDAVYHLRGRQ